MANWFSLSPIAGSIGTITEYDLFYGPTLLGTYLPFGLPSPSAPTFVDGNNTPGLPKGQPVTLHGKAYALIDPNDGTHGDEIWISDGTVAGTFMLKDINPGSASSNASEFALLNGELYFVADDGTHGQQLWQSDGTTAGTLMVTDVNEGNFHPVEMTAAGNKVYFFANDGIHGQELWASDGTTAAMVADISPGAGSTFLTSFAASNGKFFFDAFAQGMGDELFISDGTQSGTHVVDDIQPGLFGSNPRNLTDVNGTLYFTANDGTHGDQLWKTDGTAANTTMVTAQGHFADNFSFLYNFNGKLVFDAPLLADGVHGLQQLYITDGTDAGTTALTSVSSFSFQPQSFFTVGGLLYFNANDGTHGNELWVSDGTPDGTHMLEDINPSGSSSPTSFADVDGLLFFNAFDGTSHGVWETDGTAGGTEKLFDTPATTPITAGFDAVACYCRGTRISAGRGQRKVENLRIGDLVRTRSGRLRPIKWIGRRSYNGRFIASRNDILPICFKAGSLGDTIPARDLWISPHHAMYFENAGHGGMLIEARDLINGVSIVQAEQVESVEYFHIELETHDVIIAEGALSETFVDVDCRGMFHNADEYAALYPDVPTRPAQYCAPRCEQGYEVEAVRAGIEKRAGLRPAAEIVAGLRGFVDAASAGLIAGWAQNPDYPEAPVCLDIYADGRMIGQVLANAYREDLEQAGIGSGRHGFEFTPPRALGMSSGTIEVRRSMDGAVLERSRKTTRPQDSCLKPRHHTGHGR
jgi:ELWxxDGT repeat protein